MIKPYRKFIMLESHGVDKYIDDLLDKISEKGYESLTQKEKDILAKRKNKEQITDKDINPGPIVPKGPSKKNAGGSTQSDVERLLGLKPGQLSGTDIIQVGAPGEKQQYNIGVGGDNIFASPDEAARDIKDKFTPQGSNSSNFEVGDVVRFIDKGKGKLSDDVYKFLKSKEAFEVLRINHKGQIDIGFRYDGGKIFYFNASRFTDKPIGAGRKDLDPYSEEDWGDRNPPPPPLEGAPPKNTFRIVVGESPEEWDMVCPITAVVIENETGFMMDEDLVDYYPELTDIDLYSLAEGQMEYNGHLNINQLVDLLQQMGYNAEASNDIANVFN
jgi:hypothetical protein